MGTKNNPGRFDYYGSAEADEPIFILKASDASAPTAVRLWAQHYRTRKIEAGQYDTKAAIKYQEALLVADEMEVYRDSH